MRGQHGLSNQLDRAENQRNLIKAILAKGLSVDVFAYPLVFTRFVGGAAKHLQVDNAPSDSQLRTTALSLWLEPADISLLSLPLSRARRIRGRPAPRVAVARLADLAQALHEDDVAAYLHKYLPS